MNRRLAWSLTIAASVLGACAFAFGIGHPRPPEPPAFCPAPNRLVLPDSIVDTATVLGPDGRPRFRIPVYTRDSVCLRHRPNVLPTVNDTTPAEVSSLV